MDVAESPDLKAERAAAKQKAAAEREKAKQEKLAAEAQEQALATRIGDLPVIACDADGRRVQFTVLDDPEGEA